MKRHQPIIIIITAIVVFMLGLTSFSPSLYTMFCEFTGFDGTPIRGTLSDLSALKEESRTMTVRFNTSTQRSLPWRFYPEKRQIKAKLGEQKIIAFYVENQSNEDIEGTAVFTVTPLKSAQFFVKIECFCYEDQIIKAGQKQMFPVVFYIDPALVDDPDLNEVSVMTLSYRFLETKQ